MNKDFYQARLTPPPNIPELEVPCDAIDFERKTFDLPRGKLTFSDHYFLLLNSYVVNNLLKKLECETPEALVELLTDMPITHPISGHKFKIGRVIDGRCLVTERGYNFWVKFNLEKADG